MASQHLGDVVPSVLVLLPIFSAVLIILVVWVGYRWTFGVQRLPYPPGPKPTLFVGNVKDFPATEAWLTFSQWKKVYGDIIHLELLGQHYIILNSLEAAKELLERRFAIYSGRPRYILMEMMGMDKLTPFLQYGMAWRKHRSMLQNTLLKTSAFHALRPIHVKKVKDLLCSLLTSPEDFLKHNKTRVNDVFTYSLTALIRITHRFSAAIIMAATYGHDIASQNDIFVEIAEVVVAELSKLLLSTSSLMMNAFPSIRFVPSWIPGAGAKQKALQGRMNVRRMFDLPFEMVKKKMETGMVNPSIVSNLLQTSTSDEDHNLIKEMAATAYAAGADTTASTLGIFFYLILRHPAVQTKAQQELDTIIGQDRLPTFEDQNSLPYIGAIAKEVLRWMPIGPLGVFHSANQDDVYQSYYIPKGAHVAANIWAINHDPNTFPDPEKFNPERFLNENGTLRDDHEIRTFGFGRRLCVGQYIAYDVIWIAIANVLCTFNIRPKKNPLGQDIIPEAKYNEGAIVHIIPFECSITPRSNISEHLIRTTTTTYID